MLWWSLLGPSGQGDGQSCDLEVVCGWKFGEKYPSSCFLVMILLYLADLYLVRPLAVRESSVDGSRHAGGLVESFCTADDKFLYLSLNLQGPFHPFSPKLARYCRE
jgi:hypothetical protein